MKRGIKGNAVTDALPWIVIAVLLLVLILVSIGLLKGSGFSLIDKFKSVVGGLG